MAAARIHERAVMCLTALRQTVAVFRNVVVRNQESSDLSDGQNQSKHGDSRYRRAAQMSGMNFAVVTFGTCSRVA